ncbi:unnamed protein product [Paramecium sonneborni]|uniref:CSC1/OSCA1-like cytosolic domain-containing protein n=1 Tax=Paramecium sonneborni TaxID=65129 RepID=A0A8S1QAG7_9CILI|nr:unnamed protein product [Paramecium sonneborni]
MNPKVQVGISQNIKEVNVKRMFKNYIITEKHAKARRVAQELEIDEQTACPCCGYSIERIDLQYDCDTIEMKFLGSGFPLFYIQILVIERNVLFSYKIQWVIIVIIKQNYKKQRMKISNIIYKIIQISKQKIIQIIIINTKKRIQFVVDRCGILQVQQMFMIDKIQKVVLANMFSFLFFRKAQRSIVIEVDESQLTPTDYTICVKNIPKLNEDYQEVLKNIFQNYAADGRELKVTKIVLVYNLDEVIDLEESLKELVREKQEYLIENGMNFTDFKVKQLDEKLESLEHKIHQVEHELFINRDKFAGIAFISFQLKK